MNTIEYSGKHLRDSVPIHICSWKKNLSECNFSLQLEYIDMEFEGCMLMYHRRCVRVHLSTIKEIYKNLVLQPKKGCTFVLASMAVVMPNGQA